MVASSAVISICSALVVLCACPPVVAFAPRRLGHEMIRSKIGYRPKIRTTYASTRMNLFGNLFGSDEVKDDQMDLREGELARFSNLLPGDDAANPRVKFDSLSIMVSEWSKLFTDEDKKMGLTTPVTVAELKSPSSGGDGEDGDVRYTGVQLLFRKGKTGGRSAYRDKDDEKYNEGKRDDVNDDGETVKEGGVEVRVIQSSDGSGDLSVIATRCEIEEGTMVKEMSEQTIIDSLRNAIVAWKKEQLSS